MARIIDVAKAQEAFDRAAHNAVHGPRDVRADRFVAGDASVSLPNGKPRKVAPSDRIARHRETQGTYSK